MNHKMKIIIPIVVLLIIGIPYTVYSAVSNDTSQNNTNSSASNNNLSQNSTNSSILDNNNLSQNSTKLLNVPNVIQPSNFTSGPASLQAVLAYYGSNTDLDEIINMTNSTQENGTLPTNIARTASNLGFSANIKQNMSLEDLQQNINQGTPVIIDAQAWKDNSTNTQNWTDDQNNSHYMVVIGIDNENVYFEDPAITGSRGYIPNQEFLDRWHDSYQVTTGNNSTENVTNNHLGIIITGKQPVTFPLIVRIN
jgi:predicted double-glycine peptidase